tara:strand:- start:862 stop:981 length:120 start_codon:yes stop_codon:yes gene_type:complete
LLGFTTVNLNGTVVAAGCTQIPDLDARLSSQHLDSIPQL